MKALGMSGDTLMELAGNRAADWIARDQVRGNSGLLIVGKGNNGGDALVIARLLKEQGMDIEVCATSSIQMMSSDAQVNAHRWISMGGTIRVVDKKTLPELEELLEDRWAFWSRVECTAFRPLPIHHRNHEPSGQKATKRTWDSFNPICT